MRCYQQHRRPVVPINPRAETIEGLPCVASVADLPAQVSSLSIITPTANH
ncbi:MAG: CoA-binding protein [Syntrophotaleaceae bacterium]